MARTGIEEKDVFEAADSILAGTHMEPTIQAIREKLGGGSLTTISNHLKKWREKKRQDTSVPEFPESLGNVVKQIWISAFREAEGHFVTLRTAWEVERQKLGAENEGLIVEIQRLEKNVEDELKKNEESDRKIQELTQAKIAESSEVQKLRVELASTKAKLEITEERMKEALLRTERFENELMQMARGQTIEKKS